MFRTESGTIRVAVFPRFWTRASSLHSGKHGKHGKHAKHGKNGKHGKHEKQRDGIPKRRLFDDTFENYSQAAQ